MCAVQQVMFCFTLTRNLYRKLNINSRSQLHAALDRLAHPEAGDRNGQADTEAGKASS